jgi:signal transduction histidine kinase
MRLRRIHWVALDYVVAAVCALIVFAWLNREGAAAGFPATAWHANDWVPPLLALGLSVPIAIRRRDPVLALVLVLAGCATVLALGGQITHGPSIPLALVLFTVAATRSRRTALIALAASLALCAVQGLIMHLDGSGAGNAIGGGLVLVIVWMVGYSVGQRRGYAARLRQQATDSAVMAERLRIARELHDVVAHSMTVVAVQAGFGEYVFDRQPAQARAALGAIQTVTGEALADMQRMLGALRQAADGTPGPVGPAGQAAGGAAGAPAPGGQAGSPATGTPATAAAPLAPAPGLADLDRLVASTAGAGVRVEVVKTGQPRAIPAGIDLAAFRTVQEALTNVVKHSGADRCQVRIAYGSGDLCVEVTDPGRSMAMAGAPAHVGAVLVPGGSARGGLAPGGHGIAGMAERVGLYGGELEAGSRPGGGFRVAARFPLPAAAR